MEDIKKCFEDNIKVYSEEPCLVGAILLSGSSVNS
jgi:hypothetical protein